MVKKPSAMVLIILAIYAVVLVSLLLLSVKNGTRYVLNSDQEIDPNTYPLSSPSKPTPYPTLAESTYFTPTPTPEVVWVDLTSPVYGFSLKYPDRFDPYCCKIESPVSGTTVEIITLADTTTVAQNTDKTFDGIGLFITNQEKLPFETYLDNERELLLEIYGQISTYKPKTVDYTVVVDGISSTLLTGYNAYGIWYTYVPLTSGEVLVIAKSETSSGHFDYLYNQILDSITFQQ